MLLSNIPEMSLETNITLEDALTLMLTSIAMEEISLSKLIDAETNKILSVIDTCKNKDSNVSDTIKINASVNETIKNIIKLKKISQNKIENIKEIMLTEDEEVNKIENKTNEARIDMPTSISTNETNNFIKSIKCKSKCITSESPYIEKDICNYSLTGTGNGCVLNNNDEFNCQTAVIYAFILYNDIYNRTICYSVQNYTNNICMYASGHNVKIECPYNCNDKKDKVVIYGKGEAEKSSQCNIDIVGTVNFTLTVCSKEDKSLEFEMKIISEKDENLNHNSGVVKVKNESSDLRLEIY